MNRSHRVFAAMMAVCLCLSAASARANILLFHADLDGLQTVPPNASTGFGQADATLNDVTGVFSITAGSYQDLLGGANAVLLNDAAPGVNGPLIFPLILDTPGAATGTFSGGGALTPVQIADMIAGNTYLRVTSQVFPAGEIRGQLIPTPEPASIVLLALGGIGWWAMARRRRRLD